MPYRAPGHYRPPPVLHRLLSSAVAALAAHGFSPANTVALEVPGGDRAGCIGLFRDLRRASPATTSELRLIRA
jgi:hypothetical protein